MDAYDAIARRVSTRTFRPEPVPRYLIERLLAAAVRAPNHKLTEPWRFVVLTGEAKRRYAEVRRAHRLRKFPPDDPKGAASADKQYREAIETPVFIVTLCQVSEDPVQREEDYGAVMMAIENLLIAAQADGLGTYLRTGGILENPELKQLVAVPDRFRIVGVISLGYHTGPEEPRRRTNAAELTTWME
jgi:nitroreductase